MRCIFVRYITIIIYDWRVSLSLLLHRFSLSSLLSGTLKDQVGRSMDLGFKLIIDHDHRMISSIIYEGQLHIFLLDNTYNINSNIINNTMNNTLEYVAYTLYETRIIDIQFLHGCLKPTIAIIYEDTNHQRNMKTYTIDIRDRDNGLQPGT